MSRSLSPAVYLSTNPYPLHLICINLLINKNVLIQWTKVFPSAVLARLPYMQGMSRTRCMRTRFPYMPQAPMYTIQQNRVCDASVGKNQAIFIPGGAIPRLTRPNNG